MLQTPLGQDKHA